MNITKQEFQEKVEELLKTGNHTIVSAMFQVQSTDLNFNVNIRLVEVLDLITKYQAQGYYNRGCYLSYYLASKGQ